MNFSDLISVFSLRGLYGVILTVILVSGIRYILLKFNITNLYLVSLIYVIVIVILYFFINLCKFTIVENLIFLIVFLLLSLDMVFIKEPISTKSLEKEIKKQYSVFKTEEERKNYMYGDIPTKIRVLKKLGLSKENIYKKLENNPTFKEFIKDGNEKFDAMVSSNK